MPRFNPRESQEGKNLWNVMLPPEGIYARQSTPSSHRFKVDPTKLIGRWNYKGNRAGRNDRKQIGSNLFWSAVKSLCSKNHDA
jgi:hypothetical protein